MTRPVRLPRRAIPRPRKLTVRLPPLVYDELLARAQQGELPVERLAEQIVQKWLIDTRRSP